jgi:tetratricopeptide (TPR) repeat protein
MTDVPSKTARNRARALVNQADGLLAGVLDPTSWQGDRRRVAAFLSSADFERFLGLYLRAMDLDPREPAYPWNLGSALSRTGRPDLALAFVGRAIKTGEEIGDEEWAGPDAYLFWADTAIKAGQDDLAWVAIARAVSQAPDDDETGDAAVALLKALADARKQRGAAEADRVPVWIPVLPAGRSRSSGAASHGTRSTEELMAGLIERAFPATARARVVSR